MIAPGLHIAGKYVVERPLARGGMGSVWIARHTALNTPVAIKFVDAHYASSPELLARFEREARAASSLDTPHVVQVRDYGVDRGIPYLVMELLRGEDLGARLKRERRLPLGQLHVILQQIAKALRKAHHAGIVHRDLKPANIFLAQVDDEVVVKVLDFGIAKELSAGVGEATKSGEVFGSPHYMSPEQARAEKTVDARSDLWSVGVILYRAVTGRLPFPGDAVGEILSHVFVDTPPRPTELAPALPPAVDAFFERVLAKPREQRFQTIAELVDAFAHVANAAAEGASLPDGPRPPGPSASEIIVPSVPAATPIVPHGPPIVPVVAPQAQPVLTSPLLAASNPPLAPPAPRIAVPGPSGAAAGFRANPAGIPLAEAPGEPPRPPAPSLPSWGGAAAVTAATAVGSTVPLGVALPAPSASDTLGTHSGASHTARTAPARGHRIVPLLAVGLTLTAVGTVLFLVAFNRDPDPAAGISGGSAPAAVPSELPAATVEAPPTVVPAPVPDPPANPASSGKDSSRSAADPAPQGTSQPQAAASGSSSRTAAPPLVAPTPAPPKPSSAPAPSTPPPKPSSAPAPSTPPPKKPDRWGLPD